LHRFPPSSWAEDLERAQQCINVLRFCGKVDPVALRFSVRLSEIYNTLAGGYSFDQGARGDMPRPHPISYLFTTPRASPTHPTPPGRRALSFALLFALCRPWSEAATNPPPAPTMSNSPPAPTTGNSRSTTRTTTTTTTISLRATTTTTTSNDSYDIITNETNTNTNNTNRNNNNTYNYPSNPSKATYVPEPEDEEEDQNMLDLQNLDWGLEKTVPFTWDTDGLGMLGEGEVRSCFLDSEAPSGWAEVEDLDVDFE
jgi:hypothetical protein